MNFLDATQVTNREGAYDAYSDATWSQGAATFGGVLMAAAVRSLEDLVADTPGVSLRVLTHHFCRPAAPGRFTVVPRVDHAGKSTQHLSYRLLSNEKLIGIGSAVFSADRPSVASYCDLAMPKAVSMTNPRDLQPVDNDAPGLPPFMQHIDYRHALGPLPYTSSSETRIGAFIRFLPQGTVARAAMAALLDVLPPPYVSRASTPHRTASVALTAKFFQPLPLANISDDGFWLAVSSSDWAQGGFAQHRTTVASESGVFVAECTQLVADLGPFS